MNRRDIVLGLGTLGGMAAVNVKHLMASGLFQSQQNPLQILKQIQLVGAQEENFLTQLGRQPSACQPWPEKAANRRHQFVEAIPIQKTDPSENVLAYGLRFVCDARVINCFAVGNEPLKVRRFCYSIEEICWRPAVGFPVYSSYCPRYDYSTETCYGAKIHQIVPLAFQEGYFPGCQSTDICQTNSHSAQLAFDVNDNDYTDNSGYYTVDLWSWS